MRKGYYAYALLARLVRALKAVLLDDSLIKFCKTLVCKKIKSKVSWTQKTFKDLPVIRIDLFTIKN